jgi:hypothetical protein
MRRPSSTKKFQSLRVNCTKSLNSDRQKNVCRRERRIFSRFTSNGCGTGPTSCNRVDREVRRSECVSHSNVQNQTATSLPSRQERRHVGGRDRRGRSVAGEESYGQNFVYKTDRAVRTYRWCSHTNIDEFDKDEDPDASRLLCALPCHPGGARTTKLEERRASRWRVL